jgi:hypothetical protein
MGLMQLLAAGRSLGKIGDQPSRYKMTQQSLLPKFGTVKAPEEQVPGVGEVSSNQAIAKVRLKQSSQKIATAANDRKHMNAVQLKSQEVTVPKITATGPAFPIGRWTLFKNPFSKTPKPKPVEDPVQPELSLDLVKPVRNDLSDADLELVQPVRPALEKVVPAAERAEAATAAPDGAAWGRIATQFFGAGKA